jgi:hypothetical protein
VDGYLPLGAVLALERQVDRRTVLVCGEQLRDGPLAPLQFARRQRLFRVLAPQFRGVVPQVLRERLVTEVDDAPFVERVQPVLCLLGQQFQHREPGVPARRLGDVSDEDERRRASVVWQRVPL